MEDSPAGKKTSGNSFVESPKKTVNTATNQSQWSFGWNANTKDVFNRPNNSKGTSPHTQVSISTTTPPAFFSVRTRAVSRSRSQQKKLTWERKTQFLKSQSGTTIQRQQGKQQWHWVTRRQTTVRRTKFTRKEPPQLSLKAARNDLHTSIYWCLYWWY